MGEYAGRTNEKLEELYAILSEPTNSLRIREPRGVEDYLIATARTCW